MQVYTARQAILNTKEKVIGYELLYRDGEKNSFPANIKPHVATSRMILRTHFNEGLSSITGGKRAFINFTEDCLLADFPKLINREKVIVEILETVKPSDEVYQKCRELFKAGYILALDDFIYKPEWRRFLPLIKIIKFDISTTPLKSLPPVLLEIKKIRQKGNMKNKIHMLAERVETKEEFLLAKKMGFDFFQGYYFCKPQMHSAKDVSLSESTLFNLYQELCRKELDIDKINQCFETDEGLAYKLLTYMNSGIISATQPISSIKQALVYLGEKETRKFLTLLTTTLMSKGKPKEVMRVGIVRARTCENTAKKVAPGVSSESFLVGLLSVLPAILDRPMTQIIEKLPVSEEIEKALLPSSPEEKSSVLRIILDATLLIEKGSWHLTSKECAKLRIDYDSFCEMHQEAIKWAQRYEATTGLSAEERSKAAS